MTVRLELKPDLAAGLLAQARSRGLSLEAYLEQVLQGLAASNRPTTERKSLARLFAESPLKGLDLKFERDTDEGRPVDL